MRTSWGYLAAAGLLFAVETLIALFGHGFLRHTVGDFLVTILLYCVLRGMTRIAPAGAGLAAFAVACAVEAGQAAHILDRLGLAEAPLARIVIGAHFSWVDIAAYFAGAATATAVDLTISARRGFPPGGECHKDGV